MAAATIALEPAVLANPTPTKRSWREGGPAKSPQSISVGTFPQDSGAAGEGAGVSHAYYST